MKKAYKNLTETLIENFTNERMDKIAFQDKKFRLADKKLDEALKLYNKLSLSKDDDKVVGHVFDAYAVQSARYAALAYKQGIEDAVQLLKEMDVIQNGSPRKVKR
ncbi:MAG: hypothetical protein J1E98_11505 [Lachnospiraceae bacterium]|nr:hypothetical protein [Lachnospiraceae bacterium]